MDTLRTRECDEVASGWVEIVNIPELERQTSDEMKLESPSLVERQEGLIQIANHLIQKLRQKLKDSAILNAQLKEENAGLRRKIATLSMIQD